MAYSYDVKITNLIKPFPVLPDKDANESNNVF